MRFPAQDGVADIIEVRRDGMIEKKGVLHLARVSNHAMVADDDLLANVGVVPDLAVPPDDPRALDHRALLAHGPRGSQDLRGDAGAALQQDVLLAKRGEGEPLPVEHGGPVRVIIPKRYAWKGAKFICEITFLDRDILGFWEIGRAHV